MDYTIVLESLFIFHGGLALFFWTSYCLFTGKKSEMLGNAALMTMLTLFPGLLVTYFQVGWHPIWVNFTGFQLALGFTFVLTSALHERVHTDLKAIVP